MGRKKRVYVVLSVLLALSSCDTDDEVDPFLAILEENEQFGGGQGTIFDEGENAFGQLPDILLSRNREFVTGNSFFRRNWVTEPASTSDLDGLGPLFNARSCGACHFKDGRGAPPLTPNEEPLALLFRLSKPGQIEWEQLPDDIYGGQLNPNSIFGIEAEGSVSIDYVEQPGSYPDGTRFSLRKPIVSFDLNYGPLHPSTSIGPRIAPHIIGQGLLESISEDDILSLADEFDSDGDGISGKPNYVWDLVNKKESIGRFGWKANQPNVRQQVASAFAGDIGITSSLFPDDPCGEDQDACNDALYDNDIELTEGILDRVTFYSQALGVPRRRDWDEPQVLQGKSLFTQANCSACHTPKFVTGSFSDIPEYSNQTIRPYTDLLLHDMGPGLADNAPDNRASGSEWKTPPLWGLGMVRVVNNHTNFLHDGRARNFEEAILWHGGEAETSKQDFMSLELKEREAIIAFLESL